MLPIYLTDKGWNTLVCPVCERELIPAFEGPEGLEVAYWYDFKPGDIRIGFLVCGDFNCDYQEPILFARERTDAVPVSLGQTLTLFEMESGVWMTAAEAAEMAGEIERVYQCTGRGKLRCAAQYFRQIAEDRLERINEWVKAAGTEHLVSFHAVSGEHQGRLHGVQAESILLQAGDGQVISIRKADISQERILYPPKRRPRGRHDTLTVVMLENHFYIVVEGFHLRYGERQDDGRYSATTNDPAAARALAMLQVSEDLWRGLFDQDEVQRFYYRHNQVRIRGHWLENMGKTHSGHAVQVQTTDPDVARTLELEPVYALVFHEFGTQDGDIVGYSGAFPISAIEASSWYEEVKSWPDAEESD